MQIAKNRSFNHRDRNTRAPRGEFVDFDGERFYVIRDVDRMPPFFTSVISADDHWLFASSNGGLTAGRVSPATMLFPYITVDKIHDSTPHTGCLTLIRVLIDGDWQDWAPFDANQSFRHEITRSLYKNLFGNKLCYEEVNHDLNLVFRYSWQSSDRYGFVRSCELKNTGDSRVEIRLADGLQNILPAGTPRFTETNSSNLVDAYKWTEYDPETGLALFTLYSGITDRTEPSESLRANVAYSIGLPGSDILISSDQLNNFRRGEESDTATLKRGVRGAFIIDAYLPLLPGDSKDWQIVANTNLTQRDVVKLRHELADRKLLAEQIETSIQQGSDSLARIMASGDAFQSTAEELVSTHHYANVTFNVLRGGVFHDQYTINVRDLRRTIRSFNRIVYENNRERLEALPDTVSLDALRQIASDSGDTQFERLCYEYLPITFGRRHGDPSRPWNEFAIRLRDGDGEPLLSYEGNWRDIFQNWEALALSFPGFVDGMIAKFVNASTIDGYNPYRITKEGIDWEVEDPEDPWSYIGYWGDHQIAYLLKLLELSRDFDPNRLSQLLRKPIFSYANVPYRIRPFEALLDDPKSTVDYDDAKAARIEELSDAIGADGKLVMDGDGQVYQVNLSEKLLVPLLAKLSNFVIDGGIWMNTQRPEWNDANNALVGHGLSMVTLYYMRRYVSLLRDLFGGQDGKIEISAEVLTWFRDTATALGRVESSLDGGPVDPTLRFSTLEELGHSASRYRESIYGSMVFSGKAEAPVAEILSMLDKALAAIDHSIGTNRREDGLFHAYNLLDRTSHGLEIKRLYPMLEGQVAALSAGSIPSEVAADVLDALFESNVYRQDQNSFMLYPDRELPGFLEKNRIPDSAVSEIPLLAKMLAGGDTRIVAQDADGNYRFNADFDNVSRLESRLSDLAGEYSEVMDESVAPLRTLYEDIFDHQSFTGRSGTMFGFEGLGCVYWHMVGKLLVAVQENYFRAVDQGACKKTQRRLGDLYYRVREGIGFNKSPQEFGAFPFDPYSHTPKHAGAKQPGMTGQVKEELLTRFGELGIRVSGGLARFDPSLLRRREFANAPVSLRYLDVAGDWQTIELPPDSIGFTWCQTPVIYTIGAADADRMSIYLEDGSVTDLDSLVFPSEFSSAVCSRSGRVTRIHVKIRPEHLFSEVALSEVV